ncbi:MAG: HEAT repeat domain-containing protein [Cyclobacteriaceae bacterium]
MKTEINDEIAIVWWADLLTGDLEPEKKTLLEEYLSSHPKLEEELKGEELIWDELALVQVPQPSNAMDQRFMSMLEGYRSATANEFKWAGFIDKLTYWININWRVSLPSVALGLIIGFFLLPKSDGDVRELANEVQDMKKLLVLSMIEKPRAHDRIKAVSMVDEMPKSDNAITLALISTLNNDQSMNVRLAALEALVAYGSHSFVREELLKSIALQHSPLLQVALADAMIALQEKSAVEPFTQLLDSTLVEESVKLKLESTIETLKEI